MSIEGRYYGNVADAYDAKRRNTRTRAAEDSAFARLFAAAREKAPIESVLDVPAGTGRWIARFAAAGVAYTGVDVSADMLRHSQAEIERTGMRNARLIEASCFEFLPAHPSEFDLTVSTRFINWWDEEKAVQLLNAMCAATRRFILLHIRVDEGVLQRAINISLRYPNRIRKMLKDPEHRRRELGRLSRRFDGEASAPISPHAYISYHNRGTMLETIARAGWQLSQSVTLRRYIYGSVEFWLLEKQD